MDQAIECMDAETTNQMKRQAEDGTPNSIVDSALTTCTRFRDDYKRAIISASFISASSATDLANEMFNNLREKYIKNIDEALASPNGADVRLKLALSKLRECINNKSSDWSRLEEPAETVGRAAVTACISTSTALQPLLVYFLRSKKLPLSGASEIARTLENTMKEVALQTVISERASHLPKR